MIPLRDNIPSRTFPIVNYSMIGICTVCFLGQLSEKGPTGRLIEQFGMIPARVVHPDEPVKVREEVLVNQRVYVRERELSRAPFNPWITLLTCIFLHGGWLHFLGNMWFLHIFGDNVEDRLGHVGFLLFYLLCGVVASLSHLITNPASPIPTIGASGAIAGVMGAYMLLYPHAKVMSIIPLFFILQVAVLPAPLFLGIWFALQFFQGTLAVTHVQSGGVAWWAHIGGFALGFVIAGLLRAVGETRPAVSTTRPYADHTSIHRYRFRRPPSRGRHE